LAQQESKAVIWSMNNCKFCENAKKLLTEHNFSFEERNINTDWTKQDLLAVVPNARKVPQIFIDKNLIGGYTELVEYFNSN
jgi:glutaredoxin 3